MTNQELELLFKKMLKEQEEVTKQDEIYQEDIKDFSLKLNWEILDLRGYQIFEKDNYSYKFGEVLDKPDMTLTFTDPVPARKFLSGEKLQYIYIHQLDYKEMIEFEYIAKEETIETEEGKKKNHTHKKTFFYRPI